MLVSLRAPNCTPTVQCRIRRRAPFGIGEPMRADYVQRVSEIVGRVTEELAGKLGDNVELFRESTVKHLVHIGIETTCARDAAFAASLAWIDEDAAERLKPKIVELPKPVEETKREIAERTRPVFEMERLNTKISFVSSKISGLKTEICRFVKLERQAREFKKKSESYLDKFVRYRSSGDKVKAQEFAQKAKKARDEVRSNKRQQGLNKAELARRERQLSDLREELNEVKRTIRG